MSGFIEIVKNINQKSGLLDPDFVEANYSPFGMNRLFARTVDGLLVAQELNEKHDLTKYEQYRWYYHRLSKNPRRFGSKAESEKPKYLNTVMEYFDYSRDKAHAALRVLSKEEIEEMVQFLDKGGVQNE